MNSEIIGSKIKALRILLGVTQKDFGELIGVTQATLSSYENNSKTPNIETIYNIADKCNVTIDWLCGRSCLKNIEKPATYEDVLNLIIILCKTVKFNLVPNENQSFGDNPVMSLVADNRHINDFLNRWYKVKDIYEDSTIDEATYDAVMLSLTSAYNHIKITFTGAPDINDLEDDYQT